MKVAILLLSLVCLPAFAQSSNKALLLFGGEDHKTFLGCLNCVDTSPVSVCNDLGKYGSELNLDSIWNEFGTFGSSFSSDSPWNSFSDTAPIIVDKDGNSYGYFSINEYHHDRTRIGWVVKLLEFQSNHGDLSRTKKYLCEN